MRVVAAIPIVLFSLVVAFLIHGATPAFAQEKTEAATRQYNAAVALQNRGLYDLAAEEWTKFIEAHKTDPRTDRAFHYLGVCYLKANKLDPARQCFETVIGHYPKCELLDASLYCLGSALFAQGQAGKPEMYDAAAERFETVITKYPNGKFAARAMFNRGECFYHRGKKPEAAAMYAQLIAKFPTDPLAADALYALGVSQEESGQAAEAGKTYDAFLEKHRQNPLAAEVVLRRGETLYSLAQFGPAADWFAAAAASPGFALADQATFRQAAALAQLKKYAEAAAANASIPAKWPQSKLVAAANLAAGKCWYLAGNFAEARKSLEPSAAAGGESAGDAAHWLVRGTLKQGHPPEAAAEAEQWLKKLEKTLTPDQSAQLEMDRADALYEIADRRGEAAALYASLAAKYPKASAAPQALYMAAFAALAGGDFAAALRHATAFPAVYPNSEWTPDVAGIEAESRLQLKQYAEAEKQFAALTQKYPNHADVETWTVRRGFSLFLQKKFAETAAYCRPLGASLRGADARAEAHYLAGASQTELKQYDAAAQSLEASLAARPKWRQADEVLLLLAQVRAERKDFNGAKAAIARLAAERPDSRLLDRAHYRLGEIAYAAGDLATAAAEYQTVVERWPQSALAANAQYGLGWARLGQNDYATAEKCFDAMLQSHAGDKLAPRARYARAIARHQLKKYAEAIDDIQPLLKADPTPAERSDARYLQGLCLSGLNKPAEAQAAFQSIVADDPKYVGIDKVYYELAWTLRHQNKEKEAAAMFDRLAAEKPDSPLAAEARYHIGELAYKSGDYKNAAVAYHAAMRAAGKTALGEKAAHKLGWAYFRLDDFAHAQEAFAHQRATWPNGPLAADAAFMEAESFMKQKKYAEALELYAQVKNPSGKDFETLRLLHGGQAAAQLNQWEKSRRLLEACVARSADSPYLPEATYELAWAMQNLDKLDDALPLYEKVIAKTGREVAARAQFMIGEIQFQRKNHAEAIKSFFKVSYGYSYPRWQADATFEAGRCFEAIEKKEQAVKQYQELIEKFPQSDKTPLAKKRIEELKK